MSKTGKRPLWLSMVPALLLVGFSVSASAEGCSPRKPTSRVYSDLAMTNSVMDDGETVGMSWTLTDPVRTSTPRGVVLTGVLVSPSGGSDGKTVVVPVADWDCSE